ncbi:MAG: hypothetical protein AVDCRST_MAG95-157 [uncultured Adhaeribacter sp.]|uniref:Outer membrane protein beta-barrel domain-containing protein n=1 Tax=uncultured Adhaeribacter sp. TaxID=448109 RepID=A0A6J4H5D2_9BACT|nr:MAG: hypothetical protein AVDCRST_MAG95-157 [uncultured Adhaeribacter sp.]
MRYIFVLLFLAALPLCAQTKYGSQNAFIKNGNFLLGGSVNGSFRSYTRDSPTEQGDDKGTVVDFKGDARLGYFVFDNLGIGAQASIHHFNYKSESTSSNPITYLLYGPFVRGYLNNGLFGEAGVGFGADNSVPATDTRLLEGRFTVGYSIFITEKVALEPIISLRYLQNKFITAAGTTRQTEVGPSFGLAVQAFLFRGSMPVNKMFRRSSY